MFFLFDFDDFVGGTAFGVKFFITLGLIAFPICFIKYTDQNIIYGSLFFALAIASLILNIFILLYLCGKLILAIKNNDKNKGKIIRNSIIAIFLFALVYFIGLIVPITVWRVSLKGFINVFFLELICCWIYTLLVNDKFINGEMKISSLFNYIIDFIVFRIIGTGIFLTAIIFFIISIFNQLGLEDSEFNGSKFEETAINMFNYIENNAMYYCDKYEEYRKGQTIEDIALSKINQAITDSYTESENEIKGVFLGQYFNKKSVSKPLKDEYGLRLEFRSIDDQRYEELEHLRLLVIYDLAYENSHFYILDTNTLKIDKELQKREVNQYIWDLQSQYKDY